MVPLDKHGWGHTCSFLNNKCQICEYVRKPATDSSFTKTTVGTDSPDGHTDTINKKQEVDCSHHWQMSCYDNFAYYSPQAVVICIHCGQLKRIKIQ